MRVLITGAKGFIGSHLVSHLRHKGHEVLLGVRVVKGPNEILCDITKPLDLPEVDIVYHLASLAQIHQFYQNVDSGISINVQGTKNVLAGMKAKKFVFASSIGVYGNGAVPSREDQATKPVNSYAESKLAGQSVN